MKEPGQLNGGALAAGQEETYGEFLLSQATLLHASGIPLRAITLGNEPGHSTSSYPTMTMSDEQMIAMAQAIHGRLGDRGVELWALDHNWSDRARLDNLLAGAPGAFDAAAFHCYSGEPDSMGGLAVPAVLTECTGGSWDPSWASTFRWQARNLVVDAAVHGSTGLLLWNLALDPSGGPHVGGCEGCRGVVTVDPATGEWMPEPEFFLLAHVSRAAGPGATRIGLTGRPDIPSVAFANPDGTIGIFGHNDSGERQVVSVAFPAGVAARVVVESGDLFSLRGAPLEGAAPELEECAERAATIVGTGGADTLTGTGAADVIQALDGDDTISGVGLDDVVCAGAGHDRITVAPGAGEYGPGTVVHAGPGDDVVTVEPGSGDRAARVTVHGGDGDDRLEGFHGDDLVDGEAGNDVVRAAEGAVNRPTGQVTLVGGDGADELHSGLYATVLDGGPGDDRLRTHPASTATPSLFGGAGDDDLIGGSGPEALDGGAGTEDTCRHEWAAGATFGCETTTRLLDAAGGTLTLDDGRGVSMTVPAGALAAPSAATLQLAPTAPEAPDGLVPVGSHVGMDLACEWEPPVQLALPYEPAFVDDGAAVQVGHHHDGEWEVLDGTVDAIGGRITVGLDSFSTAQPVAPRCVDCDARANPFVMLERLLDLRSDPWCTHRNNVVHPDGSRVIVTGAPIHSATSPQSWHCVTRQDGRSVVTMQPNRGMVSRYVTTGQPVSVLSISSSSNLAGDTIALLSQLILDRSGNNLVPPGGRIAMAVDDGRAGTVLVQHAPFTTAGTLAFSIVGDVVTLAGLDISDVTRLTDVLIATSPECTASVSLDETSGGQKVADCLDTVVTAVEVLEASSGLSSLKANRVVQALDEAKGVLKAVGKLALVVTAGGSLIDAIRTPWEDGDVTVVAIPPGGAVLRQGGESWDVDGSGHRHHIPDTRVYACRAAAKPVIDVPAAGWNDTMQQLPVGGDAACVSGASTRGRIVRAVDGTAYYVDRTGWRHWLRDGGVFDCHGGWSNVIDGVHWDDITHMPEAEHAECFTAAGGDIIRHPDGDSYVLTGSASALTRQHLPSAGAYTCARAEGRRVVTVTRYHVEEITAGTPRPTENCLLRAPEGDAHFVNYEGRREWVPDSITWDCERGRGVRTIDTSRAFIESVSEVGWHYCLHKPSLHNEVLRHADGDAHYVHPDNTRTWIPDEPTWECRMRQGRPVNDTRCARVRDRVHRHRLGLLLRRRGVPQQGRPPRRRRRPLRPPRQHPHLDPRRRHLRLPDEPGNPGRSTHGGTSTSTTSPIPAGTTATTSTP